MYTYTFRQRRMPEVSRMPHLRLVSWRICIIFFYMNIDMYIYRYVYMYIKKKANARNIANAVSATCVWVNMYYCLHIHK